MLRDSETVPGEVDLIVIGSGAAGLTAALSAVLEGLSCLVLEKAEVVGGTSARSSGTIWIPDNHFMREAGITEDRERAHDYLAALVNGQGEERMWRRFLDRAPAMHADLEVRGKIGFRPYPTAPDYRQDMPGAAAGWRALEPLPFDGRELGDDFAMVAPPIPELTLFGGMMVTRGEAAMLLKADRSIEAASLGVRLTARYLLDRIRHKRGTRLVIGNALVARLLKAVLDRGVTVRPWIETASLRRSSGRINGVEVQYGKRSLTVAARKGVVLAGGGFPASPSWRTQELPEPVAQYTPAAPSCVGRTIELGLEAGGALGPAGMDNALWFPSSIAKRADGTTAVYPHIILDRAKPGSIIVDRSGQRFANEAVSYHEFVRAMYRANQTSHSVPAWMICDRAFIRRYGLGLIRPRTLSLRRHIDSGYLIEAANADGLAEKIGAPAGALRATIERVNRFAESGVDEDFQRGSSLYDRAGGDPDHRPNPCLGRIGDGPLYAVELHPTPLGTSRGLAADEHARVLDADGRRIDGLYVCGNDMQGVFGGEYPGAGAQLGQGMTFAWLAASHAAGRPR